MTNSYWQRPASSEPDIGTDIVIIGAGYIGLSVAFWLTEYRPDLKVTVLERQHCGGGASGKNAGFLTKGSAYFYKTLAEKWGPVKAQSINLFAQESLELVLQNILLKSSGMVFEKTSSLTLLKTEDQLKDWPSSTQKWLDNSQLPTVLRHGFYGAFETGPEYKINPMELLGSIRKILQTRNVQIIENCGAHEIFENGVRTQTNTIRASKVILAMNGYFPEFHSAFKGVIVPRRAQMMAVETNDKMECPHLYYDPAERVYWRKTKENVLIIGGKRLLDEKGEEGDFEKVSPLIQEGLENYLKNDLGIKFKVIHRWSGIMGFTEHELPLISKIKASTETYMIGGFSGHGMGLGFRSAMDVAQLALGMKKESFFSQFKTGEIIL